MMTDRLGRGPDGGIGRDAAVEDAAVISTFFEECRPRVGFWYSPAERSAHFEHTRT